METELKIKGMSCGHCVRAVEQALASLSSVEGVKAEVGRAKVTSREPLDLAAVQRALDEEGFALET